MKIRTIISDEYETGIHWVLVHHDTDTDIPWESVYSCEEELLKALLHEPDGEAFKVIPRPLKRGTTKFVHKEW